MRAQEFQPKKLVIFDIDDTLVHTQTKVNVVKDGQVTKELNSHDFTHYKLQPGEQFDFENFRNAHDFFHNSKPIIPMMDQLKNDIATGNKVVMVTARADFDDRELFLDTFRKYGVDIDRVHVYRAGNMTGKMQTEEKKKIIIRNLLDKGNYTKAIMYDDAVPNLDSFVELKDEYASTKFYAWHVSLEGEASEYHRTNETLEERKKKRRVRNAAYGPGLYGGYGYFSTYGNSDSTGGDGGGDGGGESIHENITPNTIHKLADRKGVKWDNEPSFLRLTKRLTGKEHLDDLDQVGLQKVQRHLEKQGVAEGKITLSTDPNWYGATVDNYQATGPVVNISADRLVGFEPDSKMNQPKSQANVKKIVAGLKKGDKLPPLLVRKYKDGYQVLDGHHRFWAYKLLGTKSIPVQIVPAKDIEEISKQGVAHGSQEINWVKPNFDFEWHEVEEQSRMKQVPVDVRQYYQKHFPNKDAWLKAVQNGKAVVVPPDHAYEIRNAPFDKASLQKVLAPTGHEGPIGPAKEKRVNDLFDKGQVEMPIILKTSQGLWLIGGKTRLGTANYVKGLPAKVWLISGEQGVAENFADGKNPQDKGDSKRHGVPTKASVSTLRKVAKQGGRKGQLAHWMANMKAGRNK